MIGENRLFFSDERWKVVEPRADAQAWFERRDVRRFLEAVVWILRSGAPWRDLAKQFGQWQRVYRRYRRWVLAGRWEVLRRSLSRVETAKKLVVIDSTIVKAHPHSAGALRRLGRQALGRSRGGLTTKLHALVTEQGALVRYVLTGGEVHDVTQARGLVRRRARGVIADRAYDSDAFVGQLQAADMQAIIPSRANRRIPRPVSRHLYARRNIIERWFGRLKIFRRVATRYEKTALSYLGFVAVAALLIALTGWR